MLTSRPSNSWSGETRTPTTKSQILRITSVPTIASPQEIATPMAWLSTWPGCPSIRPKGRDLPELSFKPSLMATVANTPVRIAPMVPPAPWTPNASSVSSYPNLLFTAVTMKKQNMPARKPISMAGNGFTNPEAGVMATNPATAPEMPPSTLGFPLWTHSTNSHPSVAAAVAKCVATNALVASGDAARAPPALNPNQPTHSRQAPMTLSTRLCGFIGSVRYPFRLPKYRAQTK